MSDLSAFLRWGPETALADHYENAFHAARLENSAKDAMLLLGSAPSLRWRTFCGLVTELALEGLPMTRDTEPPFPLRGRQEGPPLPHHHGRARPMYKNTLVVTCHDAAAPRRRFESRFRSRRTALGPRPRR